MPTPWLDAGSLVSVFDTMAFGTQEILAGNTGDCYLPGISDRSSPNFPS
jgi:hypothetical protein